MPRTKAPTFPADWTFADVLEHLGGIDPRRIRAVPAPGTATERDVTEIERRENRLYELVDGVLVEKIMGFRESYLGALLIQILGPFVRQHKLGLVTGSDGAIRLMPRLVRIPDVSFVSWQQLPSRTVPDEAIPDLYPDLAVEVLSKGNTPGEMRRKLKDYFLAGSRLVWFIDPRTRSAEVFTAPDQSHRLREDQALDGGEVLPGFTLPLATLFAELQQGSNPARKGPGKKKGAG